MEEEAEFAIVLKREARGSKGFVLYGLLRIHSWKWPRAGSKVPEAERSSSFMLIDGTKPWKFGPDDL